MGKVTKSRKNMEMPSTRPIKVFYCYASQDRSLRDKLHEHLSPLQRLNFITEWHDQDVQAGTDWALEVETRFNAAHIVLLLLSPNFIASDDCYEQLKKAVERHKEGKTHIVPILLHPMLWQCLPIHELLVLPRVENETRAVAIWGNQDEAFENVAKAVCTIVGSFISNPQERLSLDEFCRRDTEGVGERPQNYIPKLRNSHFQERPGEFDTLEKLLFQKGVEGFAPCVGLVGVGVIGMGGIGKTDLAAEIAHRYKARFPSGVFWMEATGTSLSDWQSQFARLAAITEYLPSRDDPSDPEREERRARHICRYLARHANALLILDNVENVALISSAIPALVGEEAQCTILYTSRNSYTPSGVHTHSVEKLPINSALRLLLKEHRPDVCECALEGSQDSSAIAAHDICLYVDCLPLALTLLRKLLRDKELTLAYLSERLKQQGVIALVGEGDEPEAQLLSVFRLSWEKVRTNEAARMFFLLASFFPQATPVPLWLLGLATGLGEQGNTSIDPLGKARLALEEWSLVESYADNKIRLHPLLREFAQRLLSSNPRKDILLAEVGQRLLTTFADINQLEQRARDQGYWQCLEQIQIVASFAHLSGITQAGLFECIAYWLARDSSLLGTGTLWPTDFPGFFYQQLFNHTVEEGHLLTGAHPSACWLRLLERVGADDRSLLREFLHPDIVGSVGFSHDEDGLRVITGCSDKNARIWERSTGKLLQLLAGHEDAVTCVGFSSNDTRVVTGSRDTTARVWDAATGQMLTLLKGHGKCVSRAVFSPDGRHILTGSWDSTIRVWNADNGEERERFYDHEAIVEYVAFSLDSKRVLATFGDGSAISWDRVSLQKRIIRVPSHSSEYGQPGVFSSDETMLAMKPVTSGVQVYNAKSGAALAMLNEPRYITDLVFSSDSKRIVTSSGGNGNVRIWDSQSGALLKTLGGFSCLVTSVAFSEDGRMIVTGSDDRRSRVWNVVDTKKGMVAQKYQGNLKDANFSSNGSYIIICNFSGEVCIWDVITEKMHILVSSKEYKSLGRAISAAFSPDGTKTVIGFRQGTAQIWELTDGHWLPLVTLGLSKDGDVADVAFSLDGTKIIMPTVDPGIDIWDWSKREIVYSSDWDIHSDGYIEHIVHSPEGAFFVTGSAEMEDAQVWNTMNGKLIALLEGHPRWVSSLSFSANGAKLAVGSIEGTIKIWDFSRIRRLSSKNPKKYTKALTTLSGHVDEVTSVCFSPDGRFLLSGDEYGTLFLWDVQSGQRLGMFQAFYGIKAIHWGEMRKIMLLANVSGVESRPVLYKLALEGIDYCG